MLGNLLTNGRSSTLGTLLGAAGGAVLGRSVDRGNVTCR
ncbi:glycine zipper 2TM domain-containing protein [Rhizobium johnstonii]